MNGILDFWRGHKTKILAFLINLVAAVYAMDYIDEKAALALTMLFGGTGLATLRQGIATEVAAVVAKVEKVEMKVAVIDDAVQERVVPAVAHVAAQVQDIKAVVHDATIPISPGYDAPHVLRP